MATYYITGLYRRQYTTVANDSFDKIAFDLYGDETVGSYIMSVNPEYADVLKFGAGVKLYLPIIEVANSPKLPTWKGGVE